ncbi:MAG: copper resistance protein, partial [Gammaproteobacteria bacterium]
HAHDDFELRTAYLAQLAHSLIGLVAVLAAAARWLQSRAGDRAGSFAGTIADASLAAIGVLLMSYRTPL